MNDATFVFQGPFWYMYSILTSKLSFQHCWIGSSSKLVLYNNLCRDFINFCRDLSNLWRVSNYWLFTYSRLLRIGRCMEESDGNVAYLPNALMCQGFSYFTHSFTEFI